MTRRTVFVSYSRKDSTQVAKAVELLEAGGADVFRDLDNIQYGDRWEDVIRTNLAEAERVLVFWSKHAQLSEWVQREWTIALTMQKRVVPILLDQTPLPVELGQFHALTQFMLPNANPEPTTFITIQPSAKRSYYISFGVLVGVLVAWGGFNLLSSSYNQSSIPEVAVVETPANTLPSDLQSTTQDPAFSKKSDNADIADFTDNTSIPPLSAEEPNHPSLVPSVKPPKPNALEPTVTSKNEPAFTQNKQTYLVVLSVFLALLAIISYLFWRRRQQQKNNALSGEKLVQEIFQE